MPLKIVNSDWIRQNYPLFGEAFDSLSNYVETLGNKLSTNPAGGVVTPPPHSALNVAASGGVTHVSITDNNPKTRNLHHFVEWDTDPTFSNAQVEHLGVAKQRRLATFHGTTAMYFRSYCSYPDGSRSQITYHGSQQFPTPVLDGATTVGPSLPLTTGSGTSSVAGYGFGRELFVSTPNLPGQPPKVFSENK